MKVSVSPGQLGAEISGLSTSQALTDGELVALTDALLSHRAIVMRLSLIHI